MVQSTEPKVRGSNPLSVHLLAYSSGRHFCRPRRKTGRFDERAAHDFGIKAKLRSAHQPIEDKKLDVTAGFTKRFWFSQVAGWFVLIVQQAISILVWTDVLFLHA